MLGRDGSPLGNLATLPVQVFDRFRTLVQNLPTVLQREVDKARGILAELLGREIPLHPTSDGHLRYLTVDLSGIMGRWCG